jgi:hypothetical protein
MTGRQLGIVVLLLFLLLVVAGVVLGFAFGVFDGVLVPAAPAPTERQIPATVLEETAGPAPETVEPSAAPAQATVTATTILTPSPTLAAGSPTTPPLLSPTVTNTATITTTPAPDVCSQISLRFLGAVSNAAQWRLQNASGVGLELTRAQIDWPQSNDAFFNIFLDGKAIWSSQDFVPPTHIGSWIGTTADRMVDGAERLELLFGLSAAESGYNLRLWFGNGCEVSAAN